MRSYRAFLALHDRLRRVRQGALRDFGVTPAQMRVLEIVRLRPAFNLSAIAVELDLTRQAVHRVAHLMSLNGLLELRRGRSRGRPIVPVLTMMGRVIIDVASNAELTWMGRRLGTTIHRDALDGMWAFGRRMRAKLPWTITDEDDHSLERLRSNRPAWAPDEFEYAALAAASQ